MSATSERPEDREPASSVRGPATVGFKPDLPRSNLSSPPLSSVIPDAIGAGRQAAELLDRLMRGERLDHEQWLLPPVGISTRQSTDVSASDDRPVGAAIPVSRWPKSPPEPDFATRNP